MIHHALQFLTRSLNDHIKKIIESTDNHVFLTNISDGSGITIPAGAIGVSLVNIEEERVFKDRRTTFVNSEGIVEHRNPEIKLNLYIMIAANFQNQDNNDPTDDYVEGLKQLSYVIQYFQAKNVFTQDNSPAMAALDPNFKKIVVDFYSYSFEQMYNFWSVLGNVYLPSVLYKLRLITYQEGEASVIDKPIEKITITDITQ